MTKQTRQAPSRGRADLAKLRRASELRIARTSPPELADLPYDFWESAVLVVPGPKVAISLRVDQDVLEWFKASGPRYQSRMNAVLRSYMSATRRRPHVVRKVSEPAAAPARGGARRKKSKRSRGSKGDGLDRSLEHDRKFLRKVSHARVDIAAGRGVRLEDI